MSEAQMSRSLSPSGEKRKSTPDILSSDSDTKFSQFLYEFIEAEKTYLQCPEEGPNELRYISYRSAFNKVIGRATACKRLLMAIKSEYDSTIRELERREDEVRASQRTEATSMSLVQALMTCQRRANQLRDRISVLQTQTAELQNEIQRQKFSEDQSTWIPGLTVAESEDPEALDRHLKDLEIQRAALLGRKSQCVPLEVQTRLDAELQNTERLRDRLSSENHHLKLLYQRLRFVLDRLASWKEDGKQLPLEDLLGSAMEDIHHVTSSDDDDDNDACRVDAELFEDEEPTGVDESRLLKDFLDRFVKLFDSARYEDAALHAARSPQGILRNLDTMGMFTAVESPPGSAPPPILFFWALLVTMAAGDELSAPLSLQGVRYSLKHGNTQLVVHAVTQNKLTFSEELGDVLTEHAEKNPHMADTCLPLAASVYEACRADKKAALSMCRRGLIHSAAELMKQSEGLTPEVLETAILEDSGSSVDVWNDVASLCSELSREDLSRAVRSILLDQSGTGVRSPDLEGARLMDHVFM
ncbi:clathrin heavy chain linker domain-containing protein 1-like isoform X2 [Melanotaenia boesemani]|uniref:clathrin heavy chain linker domain-containing protein 1-like isoform X2 n=1 Tax=Melanotaenia boesemani TaxID=1250792 RepID=UPI001C04E1D3|nr:clathrin heavy chain linker domain-containing protein 1-like isoform X2 [Melanotaenia boesemani]